jgi:hypothetical protein
MINGKYIKIKNTYSKMLNSFLTIIFWVGLCESVIGSRVCGLSDVHENSWVC